MTESEALKRAHGNLARENRELRDKVEELQSQLIGELHSLRSLANAYCANSTAEYANRRLQELEAENKL